MNLTAANVLIRLQAKLAVGPGRPFLRKPARGSQEWQGRSFSEKIFCFIPFTMWSLSFSYRRSQGMAALSKLDGFLRRMTVENKELLVRMIENIDTERYECT